MYNSAQLFGDDVINPVHESSYAFIEHVVDEVIKLHREAGVLLATIHRGGDELVTPRLVAVAERGWAADPALARESDPARAESLHRAAWTGFVNALGQRVLPRLDLDGSRVAYRIAPPGMVEEGGQVKVHHVLPGMILRYTVDAGTPDAGSPVVNGPIAARGTIRAAAFDRNGRRGQVAMIERR